MNNSRSRRDRANVKSILHFALMLCWVSLVSPLQAVEAITNVMSPVVSYQYQEDFGSAALTNGGIISPIASYQYFDWPGDDVLQLLSSPLVSFFYQPSTASGQFVIIGHVTDTAGAGLSGATVSATVGLTSVAQTTTDSSGNYALPSLGAGVYDVWAWDATHQTAIRALTLSGGTARQDFQLALLHAPPTLHTTNRQPDLSYTTGPMDSALRVFDGAQFVPIVAGTNVPPPDRMTIVLTHGALSNPEEWARGMAAQMRSHGVTPAMANIVGWDWHKAAFGAIPEERTPSQGVALGRALLGIYGPGYAKKIHFIGHSLGTLVNAAAANFLNGDRPISPRQEASSTPWSNAPMHMTLLDAAESAAFLEALGGLPALFDGVTAGFQNTSGTIEVFAPTMFGWKPAMPVHSKWADNYISIVGLYQPGAVNVYLERATKIVKPSLIDTLVARHAYAHQWYGVTVTNPANCILGFQRSYEAQAAYASPVAFPPPAMEFPPGISYHQPSDTMAELGLEIAPLNFVHQFFGTATRTVVQGAANTAAGVAQVTGNVTVRVLDGADAARSWIASGIIHVGNAAEQGFEAMLNMADSASLRMNLTTGFQFSRQQLNAPKNFSLEGFQSMGGDGNLNSLPMIWLPLKIPSNTTAMAFDFAVQGDPVEDVMVCGIGTNNLFTLEGKYIPTNTISASRLIDVSAWVGTTNELFFGFMGGTSTNATLQIENIRFYSLGAPRLDIARSGGVTLLSWPSTAGGYVVETTLTLAPPTWEAATNAPMIWADRYVLTNSWNEQSRFFRLRAR